MANKFKWIVEFEVADVWVEDGFEFTDDIAHAMLAEWLSHANGDELKAKVIKSPTIKSIRKMQGY